MKNHLLIFILLGLSFSVFPNTKNDSLKTELYLETYYTITNSNNAKQEFPEFLCSYARSNEFNVNLGLIKVSQASKTIRSNFGLMAGTYVNRNLANEPSTLKNIFEANLGFSLASKHTIWIDAGIFPSHIGFESAIGKECLNLSRSILADNSPYYETGIKLSYISKSEAWTLSGLLLNGWQCIQRPPGNSTPAFGHQAVWKPNKNILLNSSSFIGNIYADSIRRMRYFHNFFIKAGNEKTSFIGGFDIGAEQKKTGSGIYQLWYSPVIILSQKITPTLNLAGRAEYYSDTKNIIIQTKDSAGFSTFACSLNLDFLVDKSILMRLEGRGFYAADPVFKRNGKSVSSFFFLTGALAVSI